MTGVFPSVHKTAKIVPVFKKDSKLNYSNYRQISPYYQILKKYLKNLYMYKRLYAFLDYNNIIYMTYILDSDNNILHLMP